MRRGLDYVNTSGATEHSPFPKSLSARLKRPVAIREPELSCDFRICERSVRRLCWHANQELLLNLGVVFSCRIKRSLLSVLFFRHVHRAFGSLLRLIVARVDYKFFKQFQQLECGVVIPNCHLLIDWFFCQFHERRLGQLLLRNRPKQDSRPGGDGFNIWFWR